MAKEKPMVLTEQDRRFIDQDMTIAVKELNRCLGVFDEISGVIAIYDHNGQVIKESLDTIRTINMVNADIDVAIANVQHILAQEKFAQNLPVKSAIIARGVTLSM